MSIRTFLVSGGGAGGGSCVQPIRKNRLTAGMSSLDNVLHLDVRKISTKVYRHFLLMVCSDRRPAAVYGSVRKNETFHRLADHHPGDTKTISCPSLPEQVVQSILTLTDFRISDPSELREEIEKNYLLAVIGTSSRPRVSIRVPRIRSRAMTAR